MLSTTPAPVNGAWPATMPVSLASAITSTKRPQLAGCDVICSDSESAALAEWLAACPVGLTLLQGSFFETEAATMGGAN